MSLGIFYLPEFDNSMVTSKQSETIQRTSFSFLARGWIVRWICRDNYSALGIFVKDKEQQEKRSTSVLIRIRRSQCERQMQALMWLSLLASFIITELLCAICQAFSFSNNRRKWSISEPVALLSLSSNLDFENKLMASSSELFKVLAWSRLHARLKSARMNDVGISLIHIAFSWCIDTQKPVWESHLVLSIESILARLINHCSRVLPLSHVIID